jgi:DNA-binding response OmpR family regulator
MNDKTLLNTILIVEDETFILKMLSPFFKKQGGFNVLIATNGDEGIQLAKRARPDLILLDVMMPPGISGFEVCQQLKSEKSTHDIPIIFMTSLTETDDKVKAFKSGAADYITKPFQHEELLARVNTHLSIRKLQRQLKQLLNNEKSRSQKLEVARQKTHLLLEHTIKSQGNTTELEKYRTAFQNSNAKLDAFVHAVTNDLKNPLNTVIALSTWLDKNCSPSKPLLLQADALKTVQMLKETGQQAGNIVATLFLLAELFQEKPVELELLDMYDIVAKVVEERLAYMIKHYQAQIKLADIWPTVPGYQLWLEEIWVNYISNGLKYGGKPPHLELGATPENRDMVRFWVRDNGIGLLEADKLKLFTPSDLNEVRTNGEGLGLSMVRQLVEKMGGQVGVESTKGQGSLFYFTLPAYKL